MTVVEGWKGRFYEDFEVGDVCQHPLGRTATTTGYNRKAEVVTAFKRTMLVYEHGHAPRVVRLNFGGDE